MSDKSASFVVDDFSREKKDPTRFSITSESLSSPGSPEPTTTWAKFCDGFKRAPPASVAGGDRKKVMSVTELRLMATSTGLGTGLLVAAGGRLRAAGPAGMLIAYAITGLAMLVPMMNSLAELSITYPGLPGGFQSYYSKFIDESLGFALGWQYAIQWVCIISLELVVASMTIKYWTTTINPCVWVTIILLFVVLINLFNAKVYSVAESTMNSIKVMMLCGFVIFGICINAGAGSQGYIGAKYFHEPGAFTTFKGLASVFVTSSFSLGGSEFISVSAAETKHPKLALRSATKFVYWKVIVLFLGSLTIVGLLVPYNSDRLLGGESPSHASPYVLAAAIHGVKVIPHIINAVILISVTSVATAAMYSSSRLIQSMSEQGLGPKWLLYVDKEGRPLTAWLVTVISSFFAYIAAYDKEDVVFTWLLSISGISFVLCWMFICICHIRFRQALKFNNIPLSSLEYVSTTGVWGSYIGAIINFLILIAQFWTSLFPSDKPDANSFFENYLGAPVFIFVYCAHKLWTRNWKMWKPIDEIDVNQDRVIKDYDLVLQEAEDDKARFRNAPIWKKILIVLFD